MVMLMCTRCLSGATEVPGVDFRPVLFYRCLLMIIVFGRSVADASVKPACHPRSVEDVKPVCLPLPYAFVPLACLFVIMLWCNRKCACSYSLMVRRLFVPRVYVFFCRCLYRMRRALYRILDFTSEWEAEVAVTERSAPCKRLTSPYHDIVSALPFPMDEFNVDDDVWDRMFEYESATFDCSLENPAFELNTGVAVVANTGTDQSFRQVCVSVILRLCVVVPVCLSRD